MVDYFKGELNQERIDKLRRLLIEYVGREKGWVNLSAIVPLLDHGYRNDRTALESFRRYFRMGVFPGFIYKRGLIKRCDLNG